MSGGGMSFGAIPDMLMGKDPKKAILDNMKMAAMVGTGMMAAPAMAGAAGGSAATPGLLGGGASAGAAASPGLLGTMKTAAGYAEPIGTALSAAQSSGAFGGGEEVPPPPQLTPQTGGQTLQGLLANVQQSQQAQQAEEMARRKQRRQAFGG